MPLALLRYGLSRTHKPWRLIQPTPDLKPSYDVVIIGGGGHGLAAAYYLAKIEGIRNVAVIEKGYLAGGNTARNTTIIRSNYLTPEGVTFYDESVKLYRQLSTELGINLMYSERGHLTLAHTDEAVRTMRWRAEINKHVGVDSEVVGVEEIAELCPQLNLSRNVRLPVLAALYHPPGAIARHDAVAWGYAWQASNLGVEIHQQTEVTGLQIAEGRIEGVVTNRGTIKAGKVLQAVAGRSSQVAALAGIRLPIRSIPLQACVSEPLKPCLDKIIVSASLHAYVSQSARGELVMGGATDPYSLYSTRSTHAFKETLTSDMLELFPFLASVKILRQWAGIADMTPDFSPVMGLTPVKNYYIDAGWGTYGFKATPIAGKMMAESIAHDSQPALIAKFGLERFARFDQVGERGAASVGH
jgi:sarcosine oxidase subunit beta